MSPSGRVVVHGVFAFLESADPVAGESKAACKVHVASSAHWAAVGLRDVVEHSLAFCAELAHVWSGLASKRSSAWNQPQKPLNKQAP